MPGNLLSALMAGDFLSNDVQQLTLIPPAKLLAGSSQQTTPSNWNVMTEPVAPSRLIPGGGSRMPTIALFNDDLPFPLNDFRSDTLINIGFDSLSKSLTDRGLASLKGSCEAELAFLTTALASNTELNQVPPQVSGPEGHIGLLLDHASSEGDALTSTVSRVNSRGRGRSQAPMLLSETESVIQQDVPINANDDNGSAIVDYIPTKYDFEASNADYPANNKVDPDLVTMQLIDETPPPYQYKRSVLHYTLTVTQPASGEGGHLRLWDNAAKGHEYTVFGMPTTQNLNSFPPTPGYAFPGFYLEGTEPSLIDDEITIYLEVEWGLYQGPFQVGTWTSSYRTVKATVTPRIETFRVEPNPTSKMIWRPNPSTPLVPGTDITYGYGGYGEFTGVLHGYLSSATPKFLQDITKYYNQLDGKAAFQITDNSYRKVAFDNGGEEYELPLLDSDETNNPYYPIFEKLDGSASYNGPDPINARKYLMKSTDTPGFKDGPNNILIKRVQFKYEFKLWIVLSYTNANNTKSMYPLAVTGWKVQFEADTYVAGRGLPS